VVKGSALALPFCDEAATPSVRLMRGPGWQVAFSRPPAS